MWGRYRVARWKTDPQLAERIHAALIETHLGDQLIGHISRDSTAIEARERPEKKVQEIKPPIKRVRPMLVFGLRHAGS